MPQIPRPLARRLDRLSRRAHRFHRFAHHPLCRQYQRELVQIGRKTRICRGCASAALGCTLGATLAVTLRLDRTLAAPALSSAIIVVLVALAASAAWVGLRSRSRSRTASPGSRERPSKLVTRLLPASLFTFAGATGARAASPLGLALSAFVAIVVAALYAAYRRRGPDRGPCGSCPERLLPQPCSGFAPILQRERAFARVSRRLLAR